MKTLFASLGVGLRCAGASLAMVVLGCAAPQAAPAAPIAADPVPVLAARAVMPAVAPARPAPRGPVPPPPPASPPAALAALVKLELVTTATTEAVGLIAAPEPKGRLFLVEKRGPIRILRGNKFNPRPFLDMTGKVKLDNRDNGEMGLLGLVFHPQFAQNGKFYVNYTGDKGATFVDELRVQKGKPDLADEKSRKNLLRVEQPYSNHNAGDLAFGNDGKLYVGFGDGGAADDPHGNGQNDATRLGKMLRLDLTQSPPTIEVVAKGLRNPWRYSFDSKTGDLYMADVGQNKFEYVHVLTAAQLAPAGSGAAAPVNLGWNVREGFHCFKDTDCDPTPYQAPVVEYDHATGCSISGGYVYHGKALPELDGHYFYADYCTAIVRSFQLQGGRLAQAFDWKNTLDPESKLARIASFGQDQDGELFLVTHEGPVYKLVRR